MNPVIRREFIGILRSPRAFGMLACLTLVFSLAVLMRWPSDASVDLSGLQSLQVFRIFGYGLTYFLVHDIFIHQRFKWFRNANSRYGKAVRRAHKIHHKHLGKEDGECFGMLFFPLKYLNC